jgi:hypothetical protein
LSAIPEGAMRAMLESVTAYCAARGVAPASGAEIEAFLDNLLFGERQLWACCEAKLILRRELADALTDRVFVWLVGRAHRDLLGGSGTSEEDLARSFVRALFPTAPNFPE